MSNKVIGHILLEDTMDVHNPIRSASYAKNGVVKMQVVLQDVERVNRNGRLYRKKAIMDALNSEYIQEKLNTRSLLGESNHPYIDPKDPGRQMRIDLNNVSHLITRVYWDPQDPNILLGDVETAGTRVGKDFAALIMENGMQCSFSMRGTGDVVDRGSYREVAGPMRILTWDAVQFPSHKAAYVRKMLNEERTAVAITEDAIIREVAELSRNNNIMLNEFVEHTSNMVNYTYSDGGIIISDKNTNKPLAYSRLEESLNNDYLDFMSSL